MYLTFFAGRLFIADTNNSLIRYLDLNKREPALLTLELKGVQPPAPKSKSPRRLRRRSSADTETIAVNGGSVNEGRLRLDIRVLEGYHFSKVSSLSLSLSFILVFPHFSLIFPYHMGFMYMTLKNSPYLGSTK